MTCIEHSAAISELLDGTLERAKRVELEAHVSSCASCRAVAADLRRIRDAAGNLETLTPPDVWPAISDRIRVGMQDSPASYAAPTVERPPLAPAHTQTPPASTRASERPGVPYWLGIAALLVLTAGAAFVLRQPTNVPATGEVSSAPAAAVAPNNARNIPAMPETVSAPPGDNGADLVSTVESELRLAAEHYEKAIQGLELISQADDPVLDPTVSATLRQNLSVIEQAITESRVALRAQPESVPARESLLEAFRRKIGLLQDTIALVNEMRKGNEAAAGRIVGGLNKS
jgi:anti-sigma factor RsiW